MRRVGGAAALLLLLGPALACGGGGGGDDDDATAEITLDNAEAISSDVVLAILRSADLGAFAAGVGSGGVLPTAAGGGGAFERLAAEIPRLEGSGGIAPSVVVDPRTDPCDESGSVTYSGDIDVPLDEGNRLSASFLNCVNLDEDDEPLPELDGRLDYVVRDLGGTLGSDFFRVTLDLEFEDFTVTEGAGSLETDGGATASYDTTNPPFVISEAQGRSLLWSLGDASSELSDFASSLADDTSVVGGGSLGEDIAADKYLLDGHGRLASPCFNGEARYETVASLDGSDVEEDQFDLLITGADDVTIRLVERTGTDVEIQVDADGNGQIDEIEILHTTWEELLEPPLCPPAPS